MQTSAFRDRRNGSEEIWNRSSKLIQYFYRACLEISKRGRSSCPISRGDGYGRMSGSVASSPQSRDLSPSGRSWCWRRAVKPGSIHARWRGWTCRTRLIPNCSCSTGSQRLTSLFQATTYGKVVCTMNIRKQPIKRWFYIDMRRALVSPEDREDAIIGVPENRIQRTLTEVKLDLSTRDRNSKRSVFPVKSCSIPLSGRTDTFSIGNLILQRPNSTCVSRPRSCSASSLTRSP